MWQFLPGRKHAPAASSVASVHYGVTSRSELMGRAAGPVYNIKGRDTIKAKTADVGNMAEDLNERIADVQAKLEDAVGLSSEQRDELQKELAELKKGVGGGGTAVQ